MSNNFRNTELLQKLARNPLKAHMARALDVAELFAGDVEFLSLDKNLSDQGRDNARRAKLRAAVRDLRDARGPIDELQKKLDAKRKAVAMPAFDPGDVVGFLRRQELRAAMRTMDAGQRALVLRDPAFADAMLEQHSSLSGLLDAEKFIVDAAREKRLADSFGPQLAEIAELETTIADANMIANLAHNDLKLHSGMEDRTFTDFVAPIMNRKNAPWLIKNGAAVLRVRPELKGTPQLHQPASADEIADGKFYKSEAEYAADRAA